MRQNASTLVLAALLSSAVALPAHAAVERDTAVFAFIVGVNSAVDDDLKPLRYADDDAARYFDLFDGLGARTYLLTRPDRNTAALHERASRLAYPPEGRVFDIVSQQFALDVERAKAQGLKTTAYFVYAGHGNRDEQQAYLTLEDRRLTADDLHERLFGQLQADQMHAIIDACYSEMLVQGRGPGGATREVSGFSRLGTLIRNPDLGLLLSTSIAAETHEWQGVQAGVFSHEVRSGMYGAADVDGDNQVSYREIVGFVEQANAGIANERFRPTVFARPPKGNATLLDRRGRVVPWLIIQGKTDHGHFRIEDGLGVRIADFNNPPGQDLRLQRIHNNDALFVQRVADNTEFAVPPGSAPVALADIEPKPNRTASRGARHNAFEQLFTQPFGAHHVASVTVSDEGYLRMQQQVDRSKLANQVGLGGVIGGGLAILAGAAYNGHAVHLSRNAAGTNHNDIVHRNDSIRSSNSKAKVLYATGAVVTAVGAWLMNVGD